jgi:hypothetical protein
VLDVLGVAGEVRLDHAEAVRVDGVLDVAVLSGNEGDSQGPVPGPPRLRGMAMNPMPEPCTYSFRAAANFIASAALNLTVRWLKSLPESLGVVIRRAIRRSGVADYYSPEIGNDRIRSHALAAELGL